MTRVSAIILAAGASTRLGRPKQMEIIDGERLLERAVRLAREAGCRPVVVLGALAEWITSECRLGDARVVFNPDWAEGMASSLRRGLESLEVSEPGTLLMACDQPAVTSGHLQRLLEYGTDHGCVVASAYAGRHGVPAYVPSDRFAELTTLAGDTGARAMMQLAAAIPLAHGELDVDTEAAVEQAKALLEARRLCP